MSDAFSAQYQEEIRDYLLGRLGREHTGGPSEPISTELPTFPILAWWVFEGNHYRGLEQCLALEFDRVLRHARQLSATYNPHWRYVQALEGDVDWVATAFASAISVSPEYVCKTSKIGLSSEERVTLDGWLVWLGRLWAGYVQEIKPPSGAPESVPWDVLEGIPPTFRQLQKWASVAKRSRWPLLRNVAAETLRCVLEPQLMIDALPLPSDYSTVFELVCVVRILRMLEPTPREIRWIDRDAGQNRIVTGRVTVDFQFNLERRDVLGGLPFDQASAEGVRRFGVSVPQRIDALFRFKKPRNGFLGILLEAKSGSQEPDAALFQLLCYTNAVSRGGLGPLLVLGVTETGAKEPQEDYSVPQEKFDGSHYWAFPSLSTLEGTLEKWSKMRTGNPHPV